MTKDELIEALRNDPLPGDTPVIMDYWHYSENEQSMIRGIHKGAVDNITWDADCPEQGTPVLRLMEKPGQPKTRT